MEKTMVVETVYREEDRTLLYRDARYHVIAPRNVEVKPGDTIQYEPFGVNFGFFIENLGVQKANG